MRNIRLIALNTWHDLMSRRFDVLLGLCVLLTLCILLPNYFFIQKGIDLGEFETVKPLTVKFFFWCYQVWKFLGWCVSLLIGAIVVSTDLNNRIGLTVLAKPVSRWEYLLGKWLGTELYLLLYVLVGFGLMSGSVFYYDLVFSPLLLMPVLQLLAQVTIINGLCLSLVVLVKPVVAIGSAIILNLAPIDSSALTHTNPFYRFCAQLVYYLSPAPFPGDIDFIRKGLTPAAVSMDLGIYFQVLLENGLYAFAILICGGIIFSRRDISRGA